MLRNAEAQLRLELKATDFITHPGENGRAREAIVRRFLRSFIPPTFGVDTGFVTDVHGTVSSQVDIIIHRRDYHPVLEIAGVKHFLVESVVAVFENKASIGSREVLRSALSNIRSVKALDRSGGGHNYVVADFHVKGPDVAGDPRAGIFGGVIAQRSLSRAVFLQEWEEFHAACSDDAWVNTYVDLDQFALLYLKEENSQMNVTLYPELATAYALTSPLHGNPPLLDLAHLIANRLRTAAVIDYNVARYFPLSGGHRDRRNIVRRLGPTPV